MQEKRYNTIDEVPDWARPTIQKLIDKGALAGTEAGFNLSLDMIRIFVIHDRNGGLWIVLFRGLGGSAYFVKLYASASPIPKLKSILKFSAGRRGYCSTKNVMPSLKFTTT